MTETMNEFQTAIVAAVENHSALEDAIREYNQLPPLPGGYDRRVTFARFRIFPITGEWPADLTDPEEDEMPTVAAPVGDDVPLYVKPVTVQERYAAPKLKGLEDIQALCQRNAAKARAEGVGTR